MKTADIFCNVAHARLLQNAGLEKLEIVGSVETGKGPDRLAYAVRAGG